MMSREAKGFYLLRSSVLNAASFRLQNPKDPTTEARRPRRGSALRLEQEIERTSRKVCVRPRRQTAGHFACHR